MIYSLIQTFEHKNCPNWGYGSKDIKVSTFRILKKGFMNCFFYWKHCGLGAWAVDQKSSQSIMDQRPSYAVCSLELALLGGSDGRSSPRRLWNGKGSKVVLTMASDDGGGGTEVAGDELNGWWFLVCDGEVARGTKEVSWGWGWQRGGMGVPVGTFCRMGRWGGGRLRESNGGVRSRESNGSRKWCSLKALVSQN
jgi:hypothetical protein